MDQLVRSLKACADPLRLRILNLLMSNQELCVCQFAVALKLPYPLLSKQLGALRTAGLLAHQRRGRWVYYRLTNHGRSEANESIINFLKNAITHEKTPWTGDHNALKALRGVDLSEVARRGQAIR